MLSKNNIAKLNTLPEGTIHIFNDFIIDLIRNNLNPEITSAKRSIAEQAVLYAKYLKGLIPAAAKPGFSKHEIGEALDIVFYDADGKLINTIEPYKKAAAIALKHGIKWYGEKDIVHYSIDYSLNTNGQQMQKQFIRVAFVGIGIFFLYNLLK